MFGNTNIVIINELSNTLAFFILIIFHLRNLSKNTSINATTEQNNQFPVSRNIDENKTIINF